MIPDSLVSCQTSRQTQMLHRWRSSSPVIQIRLQAWNQLNEQQKAAYVRRIQKRGGEPLELRALLVDADVRWAWNDLPWLLQSEYCMWINSARFSFARRKRARAALRRAPGDLRVG